MTTATTPQLADTIDEAHGIRRYTGGNSRLLRVCQRERWGLRTECATPEDPFYESEVTWLLPDLGLQLTHQRPRNRHGRGATSVSAVRLHTEGRIWHVTDLLLGLAVPDGRAARVVRSEEFAAAVAGGVVRRRDAETALRTVHRTHEELSRGDHDLDAWLTYHHVFEVWPPM